MNQVPNNINEPVQVGLGLGSGNANVNGNTNAQNQQVTNTEVKEDEGYHECVVSGTPFRLSKRYQVIRPIGHGAYGIVVSALDLQTKEKVAIKKIPHAFDDLIDAKRILREIKLLRHFNHENVISMRDILQPPSLETFEDVYIVSCLMETDLHRIIYSRQPLTDEHIQYFVYQMLRSLKYMHSAGVLHRDLKPSNLLLNANCDLKVCDFGLARGVNDDQAALTEYVVTRWYRAPEIMLSVKLYTYAIDVWSVGCILGELLGRRPMFPGDDYIHQLRLICDRLGTPSEEDLEFVNSERARRFMRNQSFKPPCNFSTVFTNANPLAVDLLQKMLVFNPAKRISVADALAHPYMASLANPDDEPICDKKFEFEFENVELSKEMLQELMWEEMARYHREAFEALRKRQREGNLCIPRINIPA
mmetsp:Transcript_32994/g.40511  ORF Transcript_32994/g.40511 Transcript_32994/m.40511 type:complete len:418 (+) Transcript_32994:281-1534(+)|eukprot:CAMPEP_0204832716 /NCGR_PEP_ID=MMETSP1346-20131115/14483_1 /ASSEMBLY_ACC=CAM_ASM_000771 /TAXON_ID=215587 /ORGANISM="Aplanochytrium stocchinoi, Strain GSBS06" /LENGTH=417 /DNA_ID=CAMNT_0051964697 /DNA_START=219 /DNA_END=1472 /DNA_ORIENTATION=+